MPAGHKHIIREVRGLFERLKNLVTDTLQIGESPNYVKINPDEGWVLKGEATNWEDLAGSLIGRRLSAGAGRVDYDWDNNSVSFQDNGNPNQSADRVQFNYQHPHGAKQDGFVNLHIHWEQEDTTQYEWTLRWRVQDLGEAKETIWNEEVVQTGGANDLLPYPGGSFNQLTELVSINMAPYGLSAQLQFQLTRTDNNGGRVEATFVDAHVEMDTAGSREEYAK